MDSKITETIGQSSVDESIRALEIVINTYYSGQQEFFVASISQNIYNRDHYWQVQIYETDIFGYSTVNSWIVKGKEISSAYGVRS